MRRAELLDRALRLSWFSIAFGLLSGTIAIVSGLEDASLAVLASGLTVLADMTGSVVLVARFRIERADPTRGDRVERLAARIITGVLALIAVVVGASAIHELSGGVHPGGGSFAVIVAAVSFVVLAPLAYAKRVTAIALHSHALQGDSTLSAIGAATAIFALVGLVLYHAFGWWWADRVVALVIAAAAAVEAWTLLTSEAAGD